MKWSILKKKTEEDEERTTPVGAVRNKAATKADKWALSAVVQHVTFADERMIAWYLADPINWSFRSVAEGEDLIRSQAVRLAELFDTTVYIRVTTRPYPVHHWAKAAYRNAPEPRPGFQAMMDRDQRHMSAHAQADKLVYYGVDLGGRGMAVKALGKVMAGAVDREMRALQERLDAIDVVMAGHGLACVPARGADLEWLLARSFALGSPVPVPDPDEEERTLLDGDDLAEYVSTADWSAEPLGATTKITTSVSGRQVVRHVCVLTLARMSDVAIPEGDVPWMAKADALPFPVEWSAQFVPRSADEVMKEMTKVSNRIDAQMSHWQVDHGKRAPKQLSRQAGRAAAVEDEMRSEFTGLSTRTRGWYRIAVSGRDEQEALARATAVVEHYKPKLRFVRELGQYHLAREFVPGEPRASDAHARKFPILKVAAGLPAITAEVGDRRGFHIGETAGVTGRAVCFDPHFLPEVMEASGLCPIVGTLGSGKSVLAALLAYKQILAGVRGVALDPAGRMQRMVQLPEIAPYARSISVMGGRSGSLSPYAAVPEPNRVLVQIQAEDLGQDFDERWQLAREDAKAKRRDLALMSLQWSLPLEMGRNDQVRRYLRRAVNASPDTPYGSLINVITQLDRMDSDGQEIAEELRNASRREIGRLFFHATQHLSESYDDQFVFYSLKGMLRPDREKPMEDWDPDELLSQPIMTLAAWTALNVIYRGDPHERKTFVLDEAQEVVDGGGTGRSLVYKLSTDSRKNNCAAFVLSQNASTVLGQDISNFVGACFVGRTSSDDAQRDALKLLRKPEGQGYEQLLAGLSPQMSVRHLDAGRGHRTPREFIYSDGLGGEGGRGGMEKIKVTLEHHPELMDLLDSTPDQTKRAALRGAETVEEPEPERHPGVAQLQEARC